MPKRSTKQRQVLVCSASILLFLKLNFTRPTVIILQFIYSQLPMGGSIITSAEIRGQGGGQVVHRGSVVLKDGAPAVENGFVIDVRMGILLPKNRLQF